jgi:mono/diheme cytochrome c family protein
MFFAIPRGGPLKTSQLAVVLFLSLAAASAQTSTADATLTSNPVFQKNCVRCHGDNAQGRFMHGPSLVSNKKVHAATPDDLHNIIANGKGHMPKFGSKLTPEEIDALAHEVKALNVK